jgi:hypothetical protein
MRRVILLFLAFHTCALPALAVSSGQSVAQSAGSSAEQQIYDRFRDWTSGVPVDQRGAGLLAQYRQHLQKQGLAPAEIDGQIAIIEREGRRLEAERWNAFFTADRPRFNVMPNAFLVQMAEPRQPGTALDVGMGQGRNSLWLARQAWQVTGFDPATQGPRHRAAERHTARAVADDRRGARRPVRLG